MELDHQAIHVVDLNRSVAFYESILGFPSIPEPFQDGRHTWLRTSSSSALHVVSGAAAPVHHPIDIHIAFRTRRFEALLAKLKAASIPCRSFKGDIPFAFRPDGIRQTYFQDPDGYWIELNDAHP